MAVNQKLIEASFREAESRVPLSTTDYNIAMTQAKTGVMTDIVNAYNQYESGKQKAFDDIAGNVEDMMRKLASGSEQLGGMQQANVQRLKQLQQEFNSVYGNKEKEDEVKFKIEQLASEINSVAAGFGKFGQAYIDGTINVKTTDPNFYNVFGKVWDKDGKYDDVQFSWDDNNKLSVTVDGETQKVSDLFNKLVTKDDAPAIGLGNQGLSSVKLGATKGSTFNETDAARNVESLINTPEKFANLTSSDTFGDISYREALLTNPNIHKVLQTLNKDKYDIDGSGTVDKNDFNTPKNIAVLYDALTDIHDKNFDFEVAKKVASSWYTGGYLRSKFNEGRNMLQEKETVNEKSWYEKLSVSEKNEYSKAKTFLDASNKQNYSSLQGRKTAAGKEGFFKQGSDGKMRMYYNSADPKNPIQGDRNNPIILPEDAETRYRLINSFFGTEDRFVNMFIGEAKNLGTWTGTIFNDPNLSSEDLNINPTGSKSNLSRNQQLGLDPETNLQQKASEEKGALDDF